MPGRLPINEKLDPKNTALIVIDIQVDFCSPEGLLGKRGRDLSQMQSMLEKLNEVIALAKSKNILTLYTQQIYDRAKLSDLQKEQYDLDGKLVTCDIATDGYKFYRINPSAEDFYPKYNFNIFSNNKLLARLAENNVKTLVITGVDTIYCIETAIRNGYDLGYKIVVPEDLIAGNPKYSDLNSKTLDLVKKSYGVVTDSKELVGIWDKC